MAKLVILNQGMTGRTFDLTVERTTVGRVDDNTFQIADGSVSSHHAEIISNGPDIVIKDLNSTNGTFINNQKITDMVLKPGQTLRFGQVELRIDDGTPVTAPVAPAPGSAPAAPAAAPKKKPEGSTMVVPRGVSLTDLEESGTRTGGFDPSMVFSKKKSRINMYFLVGGIIAGVVIIGLILYALSQVNKTGQ